MSFVESTGQRSDVAEHHDLPRTRMDTATRTRVLRWPEDVLNFESLPLFLPNECCGCPDARNVGLSMFVEVTADSSTGSRVGLTSPHFACPVPP